MHINFTAPVTAYHEDTKQLAAEIDRQILGGYRLFPVHYLAYAMWEGKDEALQVPSARRCSRRTSWPRPRKNGSVGWMPAPKSSGLTWCCSMRRQCVTSTRSGSRLL